MADIINLRQFKKRKEKAEKGQQADNNRRKFGRTKAEKHITEAADNRANNQLDGKKLDPMDSDHEKRPGTDDPEAS